MSRSCSRTSSRVQQLRLFQTVDDRKLCPLTWKEISIASWNSLTAPCFQKTRLENVVSYFHHREIPRRNSICSVLRDVSWEVKIVYLCFQGNTSRKFLNLLLLYLPVFLTANIFCICHYLRWMPRPFLRTCASQLVRNTLSCFIAWCRV